MSFRLTELLKQISDFQKEVVSKNNHGFNINNFKAIKEIREEYKKVKKLIIVRLDAIGDSLLFTNSIKELSGLFLQAEITYVTFFETHEIIDRCPYIKTRIYIDRNLLMTNKFYRENIFLKLQEFEFDLMINPLYSREYMSEELVQFIRAKIKIGVKGDVSNINPALLNVTNKYYDYLLSTEEIQNKFELHRNAEIIGLLGGNVNVESLPELWLSDQDSVFVSEFLSQNRIENYAVVFPGSKGGKKSIKYWGSEKFAKIVDYLQENLKITVILLGGIDEEEVCEEIISLAGTQPIVLQGQFSLWNTVELLRHSILYVGSDTSIAHFAAAVSIPTVVILGGGHFGRFFPYPNFKHVKAIYKKLSCYNCNWKCTKPTNECIQNISVEDVSKTCREIVHDYFKLTEQNFETRKNINILANIGSTPKIDLLLPPSNRHSWHLKEGWIFELRSKELLNKAFYTSEKHYNNFFDYIKKGAKADFLLALGGDHHLYYLHDTQEKRDLWKKYSAPKICYSYESVSETIYDIYKQRTANALNVFSHFLSADERDVEVYNKNGKKSIWFPQFVDHTFFKNVIPFSQRKANLFFKGKLWAEYDLRRKIIEELYKSNLCEVVDSFLTNTELAHLYNSHKMTINPPGVFGGFNVRTFEAMACGDILFQFLPSNRPLNNSLFRDGEHLIYFDPNNIKELTSKIKETMNDLEAYKKIAENGYNEIIEHHTLEKRLNELLSWLSDNKVPVYPNYSEKNRNSSKTTETTLTSRIASKSAMKLNNGSSNIKNDILVSAIVSTYNSEKFIRGCLDDLVKQTLFKNGHLEVVIVNTGSLQNEKEVVSEFRQKYSNIKYIETENRETIYKAWNIGIKASRGKLITNANTDDRHKPDALEIMASAFDQYEEADIVYADSYLTIKPNDNWNSNTQKTETKWVPFDKDLILFGCFIGPQPIWRKSLHEKFGYFREELNVVGDYEFWLRVSRSAKFLHLNEKLGLYYYSQESAEHKNKILTDRENSSIQNEYLVKYIPNFDEIVRIKDKLALIKGAKEGEKYYQMAIALLNKRERGLSLQSSISDFIQKSSQYSFDEMISKSEAIISVIKGENSITDPMFLENFYLVIGITAFKYGKVEDAKNNFYNALGINKNSANAYAGLGEVFLAIKDFNQSLIHFERAYALDQNNKLALSGIYKVNSKINLQKSSRDNEYHKEKV